MILAACFLCRFRPPHHHLLSVDIYLHRPLQTSFLLKRSTLPMNNGLDFQVQIYKVKQHVLLKISNDNMEKLEFSLDDLHTEVLLQLV